MGVLLFLFISPQFFYSQIYVADGSLIYESNSINIEQISNSNAEDENLINDENAKIYVLGNAKISSSQSLQNVEIVYLDKKDKKNHSGFVSSEKALDQKNTVKKSLKKIVKEPLASICFNDDSDNSTSFFYAQNGSSNFISASSLSYKIKKITEQNSNDIIYIDYSNSKNRTFDIISKLYNESYYFSFSVRPPPSSIS